MAISQSQSQSEQGRLLIDAIVESVTSATAQITFRARELGFIDDDDIKYRFGQDFELVDGSNALASQFAGLLIKKKTKKRSPSPAANVDVAELPRLTKRKSSPRSAGSSATANAVDDIPIPTKEDLYSERWFTKTTAQTMKAICERLGLPLVKGNKRDLLKQLKASLDVDVDVDADAPAEGASAGGDGWNTRRWQQKRKENVQPRTNQKIYYKKIGDYSVVDTEEKYNFVLVLNENHHAIGIFNKEDIDEVSPHLRNLTDESIALAHSHKIDIILPDVLQE